VQSDVESRIVFAERRHGDVSYRLKEGPFTETELGALPERDWTLLVQDVDKHLPDFRAWFAEVPFVPDWRIDDLMVSVAAPGGSVGPHRDNYDVFLCQGDGIREWRIGGGHDALREAGGGALRLLRPFTDPAPLTARSGDVLYIPPGVPHWGIAQALCVTYSIGMRAPTRHELLCGIEREQGKPARLQLPAELFYSDPDLGADESTPGRISRRALHRAARLLDDDARADDETLARAFGAVVTDPKAWIAAEPPDATELASLAADARRGGTLYAHGMTRLAWCETPRTAYLFVNGFARAVAGRERELTFELCRARQLGGENARRLYRERGLFDFMATSAAFEPRENGAPQ
jgi:50S ribosomal protein L16 3-hydroxylase